ncbi:hypothetical protein AGOR_G00245760 [Albula goreensis]|uniref:AIG1-type G domain-containing protein n=1 Tax=Albula goreensis TaxID=1534307 RepID=A0A8T3CAX7_9TELE|nr:hypothetical protein AGOR_G00245760 [Albula goreensis]
MSDTVRVLLLGGKGVGKTTLMGIILQDEKTPRSTTSVRRGTTKGKEVLGREVEVIDTPGLSEDELPRINAFMSQTEPGPHVIFILRHPEGGDESLVEKIKEVLGQAAMSHTLIFKLERGNNVREAMLDMITAITEINGKVYDYDTLNFKEKKEKKTVKKGKEAIKPILSMIEGIKDKYKIKLPAAFSELAEWGQAFWEVAIELGKEAQSK